MDYYVSRGDVVGGRPSSQANPCLRLLLPGFLEHRSLSGLDPAVVTVAVAPGPSPWPRNPGWQGRQGQPPPRSESPQQSPPRGCPPTCKVSAQELSTGMPHKQSSGPPASTQSAVGISRCAGALLGWVQSGRGGSCLCLGLCSSDV